MAVLPEKFLEEIHGGRVWISGRDGAVVPYQPYDFQKENNARWMRNRAKGVFTYEIWLKGRQEGATTDAICGHVADAKTRRCNSLIVATSDDMIDIVWEKAKTAAFGPQNEPDEEDDGDDPDTSGLRKAKKSKKPQASKRRFVIAETGSVFRIRNERSVERRGAQKRVGRSGTFQTALLTETDLWKDFDNTLRALLPAISDADPYGRCIFESTLEKGGSGEYRRFVQNALMNKGGLWRVEFTPWFRIPDYAVSVSEPKARDIANNLSTKESALVKLGATVFNLAWRRRMVEKLGSEESFATVYPSTEAECLEVASGNLFDNDTHAWLLDGNRPPVRTRWAGPQDQTAVIADSRPAGRELDPVAEIWIPPATGKQYAMGIDTADSTQTANQGSESAIVIVDQDSGDQVAQWHGFVDPHVCAAAAVALARYYNNARVVLEMDNSGKAVLGFMRHGYHYENYYMREVLDRRTKQPVSLIGFEAKGGSNARVMGEFVKLIKLRQAKNYSAELTEQVVELSRRGGVWNDKQGQAEGARGMRDDIARAWALAMFGCPRRDQWPAQHIRLKHADHIIAVERTGLTWGDIERAQSSEETNDYPGLIRV